MTHMLNTAKRTNDVIPPDIAALVAVIRELPPDRRKQIDPILRRVVESAERRSRVFTLIRESLSQLRLDVKYLTFDLEATKRERDSCGKQRKKN